MPLVSTPRLIRMDSSSALKSDPTTATTRTSAKKLAASEKYVAEPPRHRFTAPEGVLMESNATEPTTSTDDIKHLPFFDSDIYRVGVLSVREQRVGSSPDQ